MDILLGTEMTCKVRFKALFMGLFDRLGAFGGSGFSYTKFDKNRQFEDL
jgi:hypothetical protein